MNLAFAHTKGDGGFTLIELVLALAIAAVVLAAINAVFFGALRLRTSTVAVAEQSLPVDRAVDTIKNDLMSIRPPSTNNGLAGPMGTDATVVGMSQPLILELFSSSAPLSDDVPWGDVQKIDYWLQNPTNALASKATGKDLIRGITRNLLASTPAAPEPHRLLSNIQSLRFSFFDGTNWNDTWSVTLSNVPVAIKGFIAFTQPRDGTPAVEPAHSICGPGHHGVFQVSTNM